MSAICDLWVNVLHCFHRPGLEIFNSIFKYCLCLLVIVLQFYLAEKKYFIAKNQKQNHHHHHQQKLLIYYKPRRIQVVQVVIESINLLSGFIIQIPSRFYFPVDSSTVQSVSG